MSQNKSFLSLYKKHLLINLIVAVLFALWFYINLFDNRNNYDGLNHFLEKSLEKGLWVIIMIIAIWKNMTHYLFRINREFYFFYSIAFLILNYLFTSINWIDNGIHFKNVNEIFLKFSFYFYIAMVFIMIHFDIVVARFDDTNLGPFWRFLLIIPYLNGIVIIALLFIPSKPQTEENNFNSQEEKI